MFIENVFMKWHYNSLIRHMNDWISVLIHIYIDIVMTLNRERVSYLTPQLRWTAVHALKKYSGNNLINIEWQGH